MIRLNRALSIGFATVVLAIAVVGLVVAIVGISSVPDRLTEWAAWLTGQDLRRWRPIVAGVAGLLALGSVVLIALEFRSAERESGDDELTFRATSGERVTLSADLVRARLVDDLVTLSNVTDVEARLTSQGSSVDVWVRLGVDRDAQIAAVMAAASARIAETIESRLGMPLHEKPAIAMHLTSPRPSPTPTVSTPRPEGV